MSLYSEEDASYARRIAETLLEPERRLPELEGALVVSDVERDAAEFAADLDLLDEIGARVPAVQLGDKEPVPIALSLLTGADWPGFSISPFYSQRRRYLRGWLGEWLYDYFSDYRSFLEEGAIPGVEAISHEEARSTFLSRSTDFLATRIAAVREFERGWRDRWSRVSFLNLPQLAGGAPVLTPGCNFVVSTNSSGLRVFWSGAFRLSPNYFSHPTTPTGSVLQSGTYVFGVDGGAYGNRIQWDRNAVVTLPGLPQVHLGF